MTAVLQRALDLLASQTRHYQEMAALNRTQAEALTGDAGKLAQFAADKARLMGRIEQHEQELAPFKQDWPARRETLDAEWVGRLERQMVLLRTALEELIAGENEMLARYASRKQQLQGEIDTLSRARRVPSAYRQEGEPTSRHFDERQ